MFRKFAGFAMAAIACLAADGMRPVAAAEGAALPAATAVTEESARRTALSHVEGGRVVHAEIDYKNGRRVYEYLVTNDVVRFEIEIDAETGQIVEFERRDVESVGVPRSLRIQPGVADTPVTMERARSIAAERTGGASVVKIEKDFDDGRIVYEVELYSPDAKYELEIDANTGAVVEYSEKRFATGPGGRRVKIEIDDDDWDDWDD